MKFISEINNSITQRIDSLKYTDNVRNWNVSNKITINWKGILPDPPKNTSEETKRELEYLQKLTNTLNREDKNLVKLVDIEPLDLYKPIFRKIGKPIPEKDFQKIWSISEPIIMNLKHKFNRPRPKQLGDVLGYDIKVIESKTHKTPAYPSGHTAYAALATYLFSDMYPRYSSDFFQMIGLAGHARCLQGVHYPSDNEASMVISAAIWQDIRYKLFPNLQPYRSR